ncbi:MAG: Fis family transcriptional regulator [Holosporales bacterium]|jgi:Fis family transcriptional regulator|nr:Fis family transcriptional regulator [Holosporales bacterium]
MQDDLSAILEGKLGKYFAETRQDKIPSSLYDYIMHEVEQILINKTLSYTDDNQTQAAKLLGLNRNTLRNKIKKAIILRGGCD